MRRGIFIAIFLLMVWTSAASAAVCSSTPSSATSEICNPLEGQANNLPQLIIQGMEIIILIIGGTAIVYVVYSGARMILSQGSSEEIQKGKDILKWSIFGFALSLIAFVLVASLGSFFGYEGIVPGNYISPQVVENPIKATDNFGVWFYDTFLKGFLSFVGILAILMIVIAGFRYVTAQGHEEQAQDAKNALKWSVIGLVLIVFAYVIIRATEALLRGS